MAGRGRAPKDPTTRARRNTTTAEKIITPSASAKQPSLPTLFTTHYDEKTERLVERKVVWPPQTVAWWKMWADSPLTKDFIANDWSELLDAALLHSRFWNGDAKVAAELRLRVAKFGATPEDRARLRISLEPPGPKTPAKKASASKSRFGDLRVVAGGRSSSTG